MRCSSVSLVILLVVCGCFTLASAADEKSYVMRWNWNSVTKYCPFLSSYFAPLTNMCETYFSKLNYYGTEREITKNFRDNVYDCGDFVLCVRSVYPSKPNEDFKYIGATYEEENRMNKQIQGDAVKVTKIEFTHEGNKPETDVHKKTWGGLRITYDPKSLIEAASGDFAKLLETAEICHTLPAWVKQYASALREVAGLHPCTARHRLDAVRLGFETFERQCNFKAKMTKYFTKANTNPESTATKVGKGALLLAKVVGSITVGALVPGSHHIIAAAHQIVEGLREGSKVVSNLASAAQEAVREMPQEVRDSYIVAAAVSGSLELIDHATDDIDPEQLEIITQAAFFMVSQEHIRILQACFDMEKAATDLFRSRAEAVKHQARVDFERKLHGQDQLLLDHRPGLGVATGLAQAAQGAAALQRMKVPISSPLRFRQRQSKRRE